MNTQENEIEITEPFQGFTIAEALKNVELPEAEPIGFLTAWQQAKDQPRKLIAGRMILHCKTVSGGSVTIYKDSELCKFASGQISHLSSTYSLADGTPLERTGATQFKNSITGDVIDLDIAIPAPGEIGL